MNLGKGHSNLPHSARESSFLFPGKKQMPVISNMLNFSSSKPAAVDTGNSFLSILCGPPPLLQYDFDHQSIAKTTSNSISRSYPDQSVQYNASTAGSQPLMNISENLNPQCWMGPHSVYSSGPRIGASNSNDCSIRTFRALMNDTGFGSETSLLKGITCAPSDSRYGEVLHGSSNNSVPRASSRTPASMSKKQSSGVRGCPRVLCMSLCGELLISNTGILGILCSCHGSHMPVNKFCQHSGLYDVNPGYAVRMESGEPIAQWRKMYLEKFGIRAPEDHRGWDWPEELLATSHLANSSMVVADRRKVFDLSSLFTSSAESVTSMQPGNHVIGSSTQLSKEYANPISRDSHCDNGCNPFSVLMSSLGNTGNISRAMPDNIMKGCTFPSYLTASKESWKEKLFDGSRLRSNFSVFPTSGNASGSAFQKSQVISSKAYRSLRNETVSCRDVLPSSIELKLGQPSPLGWGPVSTSLSASISHTSSVQATTMQEKTCNLGHSEFTETSNQHNHNQSASNLSRAEEQFQKSHVDNTPCGAQGTSYPGNLKYGFAKSSALSVPTPTTAEGFVYQKETTERIAEAHHCTPPSLHFQSDVCGPSLIDFSCGQNGPVWPLDSSKLALQNCKNRLVGTSYMHCPPDDEGVSSFTHSVTKMGSHGFLTVDSKTSHTNISRIPAEKFSSFGKDGSPPGTFVAPPFTETTSMGRCSDQDFFAKGLTKSSVGFKANQLLYNHDTDRKQESKSNGAFGCQNKELVKGHKHGHQFPVGHDATPTFRSGIDHTKGTSYRDDSGAFQRGLINRNQGDSVTHLHQRCIYTAQPTSTNREYDLKETGSLYGFQQQVSFATVESSKGTVRKPTGDSAPRRKDILSEYLDNGKTCIHPKLVCYGSQWRDVPPKTKIVSKMSCVDASAQLMETRKSGSPLKEPFAKDSIESNQVAEFSKGKSSSEMSLVCVVPAVVQPSNRVDKIDSCTVDDGDIGYIDEIVDQGSATVRSCSSDNAIDVVKSFQHVSCGEPTPIEPISQNDGFTQMHSKSNKLQNTSFAGARFDKFPNEGQENVIQSRKGTHTTRWKMVGASISVSDVFPSHTDSQLHADKNIAHHSQACDNAQVSYIDSDGRRLKKRRSTLCQVKMFSRKRGLTGTSNFLDSECDGQSRLKGGVHATNTPVKTVKRLKSVEFDEAVNNQVKSTKDSMESGLSNQDSIGTSGCSLKGYVKARPVAFGKYGVICDKELDTNQLKLPKIVPLSQVLKASKRCTELKKELLEPLPRKMTGARVSENEGWFVGSSGFRTASGTRYDKALSCRNGVTGAFVHEIQSIQNEEQPADEGCMSEEVGNNMYTSNQSVSFCREGTQMKAKGVRLRSLYELSMRGNKFIAADLNLSQNVICASSVEHELERRKASEDDEESDTFEYETDAIRLFEKAHCVPLTSANVPLCCVCGISNKNNTNCLLECGRCSIRIHQACYGISRMPKGEWFCRPCRTSSKDVVCVLCGYGGGAMTRAFGSRQMVNSLLKAWGIRTESHIMIIGSPESFCAKRKHGSSLEQSDSQSCPLIKPVVHNSIVAGLFNPSVKQWVHMVCGLWTPGTRCPNVDTMSAFDVSAVHYQKLHVVCDICKRPGGSCIRCRIETCSVHFHPSCAHQKGLLQSEVEGVDGDKVGFYGRCLLHASHQSCTLEGDDINQVVSGTRHDEEPTCARTEAYEGKRHYNRRKRSPFQHDGDGGFLVSQVQLDVWNYINKHKLRMRRRPSAPVSDVEHDYRKEYARFKQAKAWRQLVVYKSGIHAFGLYTSQFIPRGAMVVEYIGEVVGLRVADKRETEYLSGRKLQYKSACYFFRIDREQIIDATCKGGIARFVNHSCQPNCVAKVITIRSEKKVVFLAQMDINPGEEITYDYHFTHEDEGKKIPCFCNAENCRRYLN